jgi:hypothetical protein
LSISKGKDRRLHRRITKQIGRVKGKAEDCIEGITKTIGKEKSIGRFIKGIGS